jgi:hypothetical protein
VTASRPFSAPAAMDTGHHSPDAGSMPHEGMGHGDIAAWSEPAAWMRSTRPPS